MRRKHFRQSELWLVGLLLMGPSAGAEFPDAYRTARREFDECQKQQRQDCWASVVDALKLAVDEAEGELENPNSRVGDSVIIFGWPETHLPYYYYGHALFEAGKPDEAVSAWLRSSDLGHVRGDRKRYKSHVRNLWKTYTSLIDRAYEEGDWEKVESLANGMIALQDSERDMIRQAAHLEPEPEELLMTARAKIEAEEAAEMSSRASQEKPIIEYAPELVEERISRDEAPDEPVQGEEIRVEQLADPRQPLPAAQEAEKRSDPASLEEEPVRQGSADADEKEVQAEHPNLEVLKEAAGIFFNEDTEDKYEKVVDILTGEKFLDPKVEAQASLFRALSLYAIYLLGGENLLDEARAELDRCRRLDASLTLDPNNFSPRFQEFFENGS